MFAVAFCLSSPVSAAEIAKVDAAAGAPAGAESGTMSLDTITPSAAGIRYGQAAGVALVCYGLKTTDVAEKLKGQFSGEDLATFDTEANRTLAAWRETLSCSKAGGPNECKLSHVWSCQQALKEIGPQGTVLPGLVDQKTN